VLKEVAPIRTPATPVMISFWMTKGCDSNCLRMPKLYSPIMRTIRYYELGKGFILLRNKPETVPTM
jgi:hypothetical protein